MRVIIVGAGGHAEVVADAAIAAAGHGSPIEVVGFVDRAPRPGVTIQGLPVLGDEAALNTMPHDGVVIAIGDNRIRSEIAARLRARGERFVAIVHPSAVIARDVTIGEGAMICAGVVVNAGTRIGAHAILNTACSVDHHNGIGDYAHVAPGAHTGGAVDIGEGGFVGIGAVVVPGLRVGAWATVGAGAAVTTEVAVATTVVGVPSRPIARASES